MLTKKTEDDVVREITEANDTMAKTAVALLFRRDIGEEIVYHENFFDNMLAELEEDWKKTERKLGKKVAGIIMSSMEKAFDKGMQTANRQIARITTVPRYVQTEKDRRIIKTLKDTDFSLIKTLSKSHVDEARAIVVHGLHEGISQRQIIEEMMKRVHNTEYKARRIVRTEINRIANIGARRRYLDAGITYWQWNTARDERVCPSCGPLHGKSVKIGSSFNELLSAAGRKYMKGRPLIQPPLHPFCRCGVSPSFTPTRVKKVIKPQLVKIPKLKGFRFEERESYETILKSIPVDVRRNVKALNGTVPIVKTRTRINDDPEVKEHVSEIIRKKYTTATGYYVINTSRIFLGSNSTPMDMYHEIGHAIFEGHISKTKMRSKWIDLHSIHLRTGHFVTPRASVNHKEHFSDAFAFYILKPMQLQYKFPEIFDFVRRTVFLGDSD